MSGGIPMAFGSSETPLRPTLASARGKFCPPVGIPWKKVMLRGSDLPRNSIASVVFSSMPRFQDSVNGAGAILRSVWRFKICHQSCVQPLRMPQ
jgi:hypothetical protein